MMPENLTTSHNQVGTYTQLSKQYKRANAVSGPESTTMALLEESPVIILPRDIDPISTHSVTGGTGAMLRSEMIKTDDVPLKSDRRISGQYYIVEKQGDSKVETENPVNPPYEVAMKTSASNDVDIASSTSLCNVKASCHPYEIANSVPASTSHENTPMTPKNTSATGNPSNELDPSLPTVNQDTNDLPDGAITSHQTDSNRSRSRQIHPSEDKNSNHIASEDGPIIFSGDNYEVENEDAIATVANYDEEEQQQSDIIDITEEKGNLSQ